MLRDFTVTMYRVMLLVVFVALATADSDEEMKKCHRLGHPGAMSCCKDFSLPDLRIEDVQECMEIPHKPHSCERDICFGKKRGYVSDDGTLDREALVKIISEAFQDSGTILESVKEKCVSGELDFYGHPDSCEIKKIKSCVQTQLAFNCEEFDNSGPCAGIKDLVKECAKIAA